MSTDLTTTLLVEDMFERAGGRDGDFIAGFRFTRCPDGQMVIRGAGINDPGHSDHEAVRLTEEDAIMLRDWLNDEWPVEKRDGYGMTATEAMAKAMGTNLWGRDRYDEGPEYPIKGCSCSACEVARGR